MSFPLPRQRARGRLRAAGGRGRRRSLGRAPARDAALYPRGTASSTRGRARSPLGVRDPRALPAGGPLVANPGCYATAAILALAPLAGAIDPASVVVDAKSGVSGAGRELKASSHAGFVLENLSPYRVGRHQHAPEIAQALGFPVCFVPHLLPVRRGLLATCYVAGDRAICARCSRRRTPAAASCACCRRASTPELARVQHTDGAEIGALRGSRRAGARSSSARSTTSARAPPARPCRTRTSRSAWTRRSGSGSQGVLV